MIKKAVIMAAGKGVRMLPLTKLVPKPLIEVNGKPFLYYLFSRLKEAGYTDIALIVGYKNHVVPEFLKKYGFKAHLILQAKRLGTGHALKQAEEFVGKSNFITLGGDNLWSVNDLKRLDKDDDLNYIATMKVNNPEKYGVIIEENGFLKKIVEKPQSYTGNLVNTGLYKFSPEIFDYLKKLKKSPRGEYELTDAISALASQKKVMVATLNDYWFDLGKIDDIKSIEERLSKLGNK